MRKEFFYIYMNLIIFKPQIIEIIFYILYLNIWWAWGDYILI